MNLFGFNDIQTILLFILTVSMVMLAFHYSTQQAYCRVSIQTVYDEVYNYSWTEDNWSDVKPEIKEQLKEVNVTSLNRTDLGDDGSG